MRQSASILMITHVHIITMRHIFVGNKPVHCGPQKNFSFCNYKHFHKLSIASITGKARVVNIIIRSEIAQFDPLHIELC